MNAQDELLKIIISKSLVQSLIRNRSYWNKLLVDSICGNKRLKAKKILSIYLNGLKKKGKKALKKMTAKP